MPFTFTPTELFADVLVIEPKVFDDERGWFTETYRRSDFTRAGISGDLRQTNHSRSRRGVLRGLHYQKAPMAQGKLVRCPRGEIQDVVVDIRKGSPTYARWYSLMLSEQNRRMLWVPEGFAHGLLAVTDVAEVLYQTTAEYSADHERGIRWNDPAIAIAWRDAEPIVSVKDRALPLLADADNTFTWR